MSVKLCVDALSYAGGEIHHNGHPRGPYDFDRSCLACLIEHAKLTVMTPKDIYEQRISWIRGMAGKLRDPMPSREEVVKHLAAAGILDPEPGNEPDGDKSDE